MKNKLLILLLVVAVAVSLFFVYQRSFIWQNFELINSEEEGEEELLEEQASEDAGSGEEEAVGTDLEAGSEADVPAEAPGESE